MKEWEKELYILQSRDYPHEDEPKFQSLVTLYLDTGDEKYFRWMLAAWEKKLNDIAMGAVQNYSMFGHFLDFKMTAVTGMLHALEQYDPTRGVPFEAFMRPYMKKEILTYVRTMRRGFTVPSESRDYILRKAMAIYNQEDCKNDAATIEKIAGAIGRSVKTTREILAAGLRNTKIDDINQTIKDNDGNRKEVDLTRDLTYRPEKVFFSSNRSKALWDAYRSLTWKEQEILGEAFGFCPACHGLHELEDGTIQRRRPLALYEIAAYHQIASEATVRRTINKALEKMRKQLIASGWFTPE